MADVHSKETRSYNTWPVLRDEPLSKAKIQSPKCWLEDFCMLMDADINSMKRLLGKPDVVMPKYKTVFFVHEFFSPLLFKHFLQLIL
jgi:DNA mismatch endonuclease (patch repair protein)